MRVFILRWIYSLLTLCIAPWLFIRLFLRARKNPHHIDRLGERFGFYRATLPHCIWLHVVSLGETIAATPLIEMLLKEYPHIPLLITNTTLSGSMRVAHLFKDRVHNVYLPYDFPHAAEKFLNAHQPYLGILFETELWPNLIAACKKKSVPLILINARLSEKSAKGYQKIASMTYWMLNQLHQVGAHSKQDADRFLKLGLPSEKLILTGNIKFDLAIPPDLMERAAELRKQFGDRPIWIAASTHAGEEELILNAHREIQKLFPESLLILVPRHPERFNPVADLIQEEGFSFSRRSVASSDLMNVSVYLGDTLGELLLLYACADIAVVGGSFIHRGGHNILEPAVLGKPVLMGKHMFNFSEMTHLLIEAQGGLQIQDESNLIAVLTELFSHPNKLAAMGECARNLVYQHRGALQKQFALVKACLEEKMRI